jgi:hypothetical protein
MQTERERPATAQAGQAVREATPVQTDELAAALDEAGHYERLQDVCGTCSDHWMNGILRGLTNAAGGAKDADSAATLLEGLAFLSGVRPRDEVEAALAAQMFALHRAAMNLAQRMGGASMRDAFDDYGKLLVKTTRTFAAQVEALAKLRNGGKQQVEVRYVYVDARGGQNVIGDVVAGGGGRDGNPTQPHVAGLAFAPGAAVWSPDPTGDGLSAAGDEGQDALLAARREKPGSAEGEAQRELPDRGSHAGDEGAAATVASRAPRPGRDLSGAGLSTAIAASLRVHTATLGAGS